MTNKTEQQAVPVAQELERLAGECSDDATRHLAIRNPLNRVIYKAVRGYTLSNMVYDDDHHAGYPLVDLMSNPAPCDISTGEMEMVGLVDEIQAAIEAAGLSKDATQTREAEGECSVTQTPQYQGCNRPPDGWWCCSEAGHDGPCPTRRMGEI